MLTGLKRQLGLDTRSEKYTYVSDEQQGYTAAERLAERWVPTTCGYCSVGCGMEIGVRGGRAVAVRGDSNHPVNKGKLCPKGLSEHHTLAGAGTRTLSAASPRRNLLAGFVGRGNRDLRFTCWFHPGPIWP